MLWTLSTLVLLVLLTFGFLQTGVGKDLVKDFTVDVLNGVFKGRFEIDHLSGFLPFEARLEGVRLFDPDGELIAKLSAVETDFAPLELLDTTVALSNLVIERPEVMLFDDEGRLTFARALELREPPVDDGPSPWVVRIDRASLDEGSLEALVPMTDVGLESLAVNLDLKVTPEALSWPKLELHAVSRGQSPLAQLLGGPLTLATSGRLIEDRVEIDGFNLSSGPHLVEVLGTLWLGTTVGGELDIARLTFDLDRLPRALAERLQPLSPSLVTGSGRAAIDADSLLTADLNLDTPLGWFSMSAEGALGQAPGGGISKLGQWHIEAKFLDVKPTAAVIAKLPDELARLRSDLVVEARGFGLPPGRPRDGGRLSVEVELIERHPSRSGHLQFNLDRVEGRSGLSFETGLELREVKLHPWLELFGETDLRVELPQLMGRGRVDLREDGPPSFVAMAGFDVAALGTLRSLEPPMPLSLEQTAGTLHVQWPGSGWPTGFIELDVKGLEFSRGRAESLKVALELEQQQERHQLVGTIRATKARWNDIAVESLELPVTLGLESVLGGPLPDTSLGSVALRASGIEALDARLGGVTSNFRVGLEEDGLSVSGPLSVFDFGLGTHLSLARSNLILDLGIPRSLWVPTAKARPISARIDGKISGLREGALAIEEVDFESFELTVPLTREGIAGTLGTRGRVSLSRVSASDLSTEGVTIEAMAQLSLPTLALSGSSTVEFRQTKLPRGHTFERSVLTLRGLGDAVGFEAEFEEGPQEGRRKNSVRMMGKAILPLRNQPVEIALETLSVGGIQERPWLLVEQALFDRDGWISVEKVVLQNPYDAGQLTASGRFQPASGSLALKVRSSRMVLSAWRDYARDLLSILTRDAGASLLSEQLGGSMNLDFDVGGSLDALEMHGEIGLSDLSFRTLTRANLSAKVHTDEAGLTLEGLATWGEKTDLKLSATLPLTISPKGSRLIWREDAQMQLKLGLLEPDLERLVGMTAGVVGVRPSSDLNGDLDFSLKIGGTPRSPTMTVALYAKDFVFGESWQGGSLTVDGSASYDVTGFRAELLDKNEKIQVQLDAQLPFALPRLLVEPDPVAWARSRLENGKFLIELDLPKVALAETPFAPLWPESLDDWQTRIDLTMDGTLVVPNIEGVIEVSREDNASTGLSFAVAVATRSGGVIEADIEIARAGKRRVLGGGVTLPSPAAFLRDPGNFGVILRDSRFGVKLETATLTTADIWELDPGLGESLRRMFPDGAFKAGLSASGNMDGVAAVLEGTVQTGGEELAKSGATANRNIAERVDFRVTLERALDVKVDVLQQRGETSPALRFDATLALSGDELISGEKDLGALEIQRGRLRAEGFRLEGLAAAFRNVLGGSGGVLDGEVSISGTTRSPRFSDGLCAQFEPLDVVPLGLEQERLAFNLGFEDGMRWWATKTERCLEVSRSHPLRKGCELDEPSVDEGSEENWRTTGFGLSLGGTIPSLDPKEMSLSGCLRLENYQVLDTKDLKGRIDANIDLSGTVARPSIEGEVKVVSARLAPSLASRNVRPVGLPLDVHLVKGPARPREKRIETAKPKSPLNVDIAVYMPRDAVRIEPSMTLPLGEVRANLYPFTSATQGMSIKMKEGVLSLIGTIEVPRETVTIYGKNFTVDEDSRVVFRGNMASDPQLFFTARHNISYVDLSSLGLTTNNESEVVVRVTGTPMKPRLAFSSSPAMDETNILSVVALGVPAGGGAGLGEAVQSQLLTAMMGMATLQFARDFQRRLALDIMRVEARSLDPRETRLTVGKRLTRDLTLYYDLDPSAREGEDVNAGSLEYRVTRFLSLLARAGDSNDVGLELNLRFQDTPSRKAAATGK